MAPKGKSVPEGEFLNAVKRDFGSMDKLEAEFTNKAVAHFGSGWAWLVHDPKSNTLKVMSTANEMNPMQRLHDFIRFTGRGITSATRLRRLGACLLSRLSIFSSPFHQKWVIFGVMTCRLARGCKLGVCV